MSKNPAGWRVSLNGMVLSGGEWDAHDLPDAIRGTLTSPPDGLGLPGLRTEDVTFPQRDGVQMFRDWYEPRTVTLADVVVCESGCGDCLSVRERVRDIMRSWDRGCGEAELVIWTDCSGPDDDIETRSLVGPFGVVGRPRQALLAWDEVGCAHLTLRFDAIDHRMYILDADGEPGSGTQCVRLSLSDMATCWDYDDGGRCYQLYEGGLRAWCYLDESGSDTEEVTVNVEGTECEFPTLTFHGPLTQPRIENVDSGDY